MENLKRWTRPLLITGLLVAAFWTIWPTVSEAGGVFVGPASRSWELTPEALLRTSLGEDCPEAGLQVCREQCDAGVPTGVFRCFAE